MTPLERAAEMYAERVDSASASGFSDGEAMAANLGLILSGLDLGDPMDLLRSIHAAGQNAAVGAIQSGLGPAAALYSACVVSFTLGALATHAAQEGT